MSETELIHTHRESKRAGKTGEDNARAKLTNGEVDMIRNLHEQHGMTYAALADKFDVSVSLIGKICRYQRRPM